MDIERKLIESRREVCDEIERALRDALSRALGVSCSTLLQTVIEHKGRLACLQTSAATWYYVDEQCIYGHGPLETVWTRATCTVRQEVLDPAGAPLRYARTIKASFQPDGSTKFSDVPYPGIFRASPLPTRATRPSSGLTSNGSPLPRWKRFLARLLLGDGWVHFRFTRKP